ncbi:hypothetical protein LC593_26970 [Nostoc sp. CHAB 5844]|nr:hypothetical protein [Nostoc sp. CHAB 5844]
MSQSQVAEAIGVHKFLMSRFLKEKQLESKPGKDYRSHKIDFDSMTGNRGGNGKINIIAINLASEFWATQAFKGNIKAQSLAYACIQEALERRCDAVFQQVKSEQEYEEKAINSRQTWQESRRFLLDAFSRVYPSKKMSYQVSY